MKAIVQQRYGGPDQLRLEHRDLPAVVGADVRVRVRAAAVNPVDWHAMRGRPLVVRLMGYGLLRPKPGNLGADLAGVVDAVGPEVKDLRPGDEIFGARSGALAEYVVGGKNFIPKPSSIPFGEAGAVAVAGCTALQGLRDHGRLQAGQRILINGASGGVGTFAIQIAKDVGAHVTAVCSTPNVELVRSLGADEVVDYTVEDFARSDKTYDAVLDLVGNRSLSDIRRVVAPKGTAVLIGGEAGLLGMVKSTIVNLFVGQRLVSFLAKINKDDLRTLGEMIDAGRIRVVVDRTYPLSEAADAIGYLETKRARGKVVVTVS